MHRRTLLSVAIATFALSLPASSATTGKPETELYLDVATHSMPGMPELGGLGRAAMGLFGGGGGSNSYGMTRFPALPGQYLDVAMRNTLNPAGTWSTASPPASSSTGAVARRCARDSPR